MKKKILSVSDWVKKYVSLIPANKLVLDLACGSGRNTRFLLKRGYKVYLASLQGSKATPTFRHDPRSLALAVMRFYRSHKKGK